MNAIFSILSPEGAATMDAICAELGLRQSVMFRARGTAVQSMLDILGIESTARSVVLAVADDERREQLFEEARRRIYIGVPGHGLLVSVPVKSVGGGKTLAYLNQGADVHKRTVEEIYPQELIIVIANEGKNDMVMNAARSAGATGGTVLHGKGTTSPEMEKFFNVSIGREKEVILIVARSGQKARIMKAILEKAGPDTEAGAISFSLPVNAAAGFGMQQN